MMDGFYPKPESKFDWNAKRNMDVVVAEYKQYAIAVFTNGDGDIVILQEAGDYPGDEEQIILIKPEFARFVIDALVLEAEQNRQEVQYTVAPGAAAIIMATPRSAPAPAKPRNPPTPAAARAKRYRQNKRDGDSEGVTASRSTVTAGVTDGVTRDGEP